MAAWEPKVPREGDSYAPAAYDVFEWGGDEMAKPSTPTTDSVEEDAR
jgi:hypothetical protein